MAWGVWNGVVEMKATERKWKDARVRVKYGKHAGKYGRTEGTYFFWEPAGRSIVRIKLDDGARFCAVLSRLWLVEGEANGRGCDDSTNST